MNSRALKRWTRPWLYGFSLMMPLAFFGSSTGLPNTTRAVGGRR